MNILFVCTGNTCRSPMAEALLNHYSSGAVVAKSAGLFALDGDSASSETVQVLKDQGIEVEHTSQRLTPNLVEWSDLILTMTSSHKHAVLAQYPEKTRTVGTIKEHLYENNEVFNRLQKLYEKVNRLQFESTQEQDIEGEKVEQLMKEIHTLEQSAPSVDVLDPYGGPIKLYWQTFKELDELIQKLTKKYS